MIDKIGAIVVDSKRLLVAREHGLDVFFIPGGTREHRESDLETLEREVLEELSAKVKKSEYYKTFFAAAHHGSEQVQVTAYFVELDGQPAPNSEIEELLWVDRDNYTKHNLGNALKVIIPELIKDGVL